MLGIVGRHGNKEGKYEFPGESFNVGYGTAAILKRADFLDSDLGYLADGKMTLYCKVSDFVYKIYVKMTLLKYFSADNVCKGSSRKQQGRLAEPKTTQ